MDYPVEDRPVCLAVSYLAKVAEGLAEPFDLFSLIESNWLEE